MDATFIGKLLHIEYYLFRHWDTYQDSFFFFLENAALYLNETIESMRCAIDKNTSQKRNGQEKNYSTQNKKRNQRTMAQNTRANKNHYYTTKLFSISVLLLFA